MSAPNANLILGFRPTPNLGPNMSQTISDAGNMLQIQQQQKKVERDNALMGIFKDPSALDGTGNPTPQTLQKVMSVDPQVGMTLRQNMLIGQEHKLRSDALSSDLMSKKMDKVNEAATGILESYEADVRNGVPEEQARRNAQEALSASNKNLVAGGGFTQEEAGRFPQAFDPNQMRNVVAGTKQYQEYVKQKRATAEEDRKERHDKASENTGQWKPGFGTDEKGTTVPGMWFAPKSGGEPVFHAGVVTAPAGGGSPAAAAERDAETIGRLGEKKDRTPDEDKQLEAANANVAARNKIAADKTTAVTGAREGATIKGKDHFAIESDVMRDHPDWTPGQVAQETATRAKLAATLPGSVAADRAAIAKDVNDDPEWKRRPDGERAAEIEHRYQVSRQATMDPEVAHNLARQYVATGNVNVFSGFRRNTQMMNQIEKAVIEEQTRQGRTPEQVARSSAEFAAFTQGLKAFEAGGKLEPIVRSQNVAVQHLGVLGDAADALGNKNVGLFNTLKNRWAQETGQPAPNDFSGVKRIVGEELVKAILGSAGALGDRESLDRDLSIANSPRQLTSLISKYKQLMAGQLSGMRQSYDRLDTGKSFDDTFLAPETRKQVAKYAPAPPVPAPPGQTAGQPPQPPFQIPEPLSAADKSGKLAHNADGTVFYNTETKKYYDKAGKETAAPGAQPAPTVTQPAAAAAPATKPAPQPGARPVPTELAQHADGVMTSQSTGQRWQKTGDQMWPIPEPMPAKEDGLKNGMIYQTKRGPARWDSEKKQFFTVGGS